MSSNVYTLKIDIDDTKIRAIEQRLMNIVGGGKAGGIGSQMTTVAGGGGKNANMMKNIAKIAGIAVGVIAIVAMVRKLTDMLIQSSPMLQQMLKLFNFGIMLILRPIGDFIGFFLRPIILYFLRNIAIPWYRLSRNWFMTAGAKAGQAFINNPIGSIIATLGGVGGSFIINIEAILGSVQGHLMKLQLGIEKWINNLNLPSLADFSLFVTNWVDSLDLPSLAGISLFVTNWIDSLNLPSLAGISLFVTNWIDSLELPSFDGIGAGIRAWILEQVSKLPGWGLINGFIDRWIGHLDFSLPTWDVFILDITTWIDGLSLPTWDDVNARITSIMSSAQELMDLVWGLITGLIDMITGAAQKQIQQTVINPVIIALSDSNNNGIPDFIDDIKSSLSDSLKSVFP